MAQQALQYDSNVTQILSAVWALPIGAKIKMPSIEICVSATSKLTINKKKCQHFTLNTVYTKMLAIELDLYLQDLISFGVVVDKRAHDAVWMKKPRRPHSVHFITQL